MVTPGGGNSTGGGELLKQDASVADPRTMKNGGAVRRLTAAVIVGILATTALVTSSVSSGGAAAARKVSAWLPYWDARGNQTVVDNADLLADLSPFWYELRGDGVLAPFADAENPTIVTGAQSRGVKVLPTVTNNFDPARVHTMLSSGTRRAAHTSALVDLVVAKGYDGIDLDYESLQAGDRSLFTTFVNETATALHQRGKQLSITVHPKTAEPGTWDGPQAQDYKAIGAVADRVRVMAYDYHWSTSPAGAIAPLPWVDQVAAFAASQIAPGKVQLGVALYGYDWVGSKGEGLTFDQITSRMAQHGASRQWSSADSSPWFRYTTSGVTHDVWYEDAQSVEAKLAVVDKYGLAGAVLWRLGGEDAAVWSKARTRWGGTVTADVAAPTAPTALKGVPSRKSTDLTWAASTDTGGSGLAGYDVYRATTEAGPFTKIGSSGSTSFTSSGLSRARDYWYFVRARDGANNVSAQSLTVKVRTK